MRIIVLTCLFLVQAAVCFAQQSTDSKTQKPTAPPMETIKGAVMYRERIALPDTGAVLDVQLIQTDALGRTLRIVTESAIPIKGQVPVDFTLVYNPQMVDTCATYAILARISHTDTVLFASPALTPLTLPVKDDQKLMLMRAKAFEEAVAPKEDELTGRRWELRTLYGAEVERFGEERIPSMAFLPQENRINGHDGCNNFTASYTQDALKINFGLQAGTLKMCMNGMEQAASLATALSETNSWHHAGNMLELRSYNRVVATFEGVALQ